MKTASSVAMALVAMGAGLGTGCEQASAFDRGCRSQAIACYGKVRRPGVYATVERPVVIAPDRREVQLIPAVVQPRPYRVELARSRVLVERGGTAWQRAGDRGW